MLAPIRTRPSALVRSPEAASDTDLANTDDAPPLEEPIPAEPPAAIPELQDVEMAEEDAMEDFMHQEQSAIAEPVPDDVLMDDIEEPVDSNSNSDQASVLPSEVESIPEDQVVAEQPPMPTAATDPVALASTSEASTEGTPDVLVGDAETPSTLFGQAVSPSLVRSTSHLDTMSEKSPGPEPRHTFSRPSVLRGTIPSSLSAASLFTSSSDIRSETASPVSQVLDAQLKDLAISGSAAGDDSNQEQSSSAIQLVSAAPAPSPGMF